MCSCNGRNTRSVCFATWQTMPPSVERRFFGGCKKNTKICLRRNIRDRLIYVFPWICIRFLSTFYEIPPLSGGWKNNPKMCLQRNNTRLVDLRFCPGSVSVFPSHFTKYPRFSGGCKKITKIDLQRNNTRLVDLRFSLDFCSCSLYLLRNIPPFGRW